ncbi:MAG TPA: hypothetical protein VGH29_00915, partial [Candidatus Binataceae bacterium]
MFHVELFTSSIATGANTFAQVNYVQADAILPKLVNGVQVAPQLAKVMFVAGVSANLGHVRIQAPSMLPYPYPTLDPNNRGTAFESPPRIHDLRDRNIQLAATEEFDVFATQNAAGAQSPLVLVGFWDGVLAQKPTGRYFSVHWTAAQTLTANAWTQVTPVFDQGLPAGFYSMVGARTFSATALFHRMFPAMAPLWRPGGIAVQSYDQLDEPNARGHDILALGPGWWGEWLRFYQNVPP